MAALFLWSSIVVSRMCGQKKHIFLHLGWGVDDMGSQAKAMFLIPIEFGWMDFTVGIPRQGHVSHPNRIRLIGFHGAEFYLRKVECLPICQRCTNAGHMLFVQKPCHKCKQYVQLVEINFCLPSMLWIWYFVTFSAVPGR